LYDGIIRPIPNSSMWGEASLPSLDPPFELRKKRKARKAQEERVHYCYATSRQGKIWQWPQKVQELQGIRT